MQKLEPISSKGEPPKGIQVELGRESMLALPDRALYWPESSTLFVADLHLGKSASMRSASIPVPRGITEATLDRLCAVLRTTRSNRLVILGDLWHDHAGRNAEVEGKLCRWRDGWPSLEIALVTGNHDLRTGRTTEIAGIVEYESMKIGPFVCRHHPEPDQEGYVLCGHIHPSIKLEGRGSQLLRLPCFWFGPRIGVMPAFGEMTGTASIEPEGSDRVLAIAADQVFQVLPRMQLN